MTPLTKRLREMAEFKSMLPSDCYIAREEIAEDCGAEHENSRLRPLVEALISMADNADKITWICDCKCDIAYTARGRHEPNEYCDEMDELKDALAKLKAVVGE